MSFLASKKKLAREIHQTHYDALVIGTGAGGAVVAKELAEQGLKVGILEEGIHHKVSDHKDQAHEAVCRMYRDRGFTMTLGQPMIPIPLGRAVGGTTIINSGTCFRTPPSVIRRWQQEHGLDGLSSEILDPIFERVEREIHVEESKFEVMSECSRIVHRLLEAQGLAGRPLRRNIKNCDGCGFCCYGCPSGAKQSTDLSYMPKALRRGAELFTRTMVTKIIHNQNRVTGVEAQLLDDEYKPTGYSKVFTADSIIVATGTLITPHLLSRNGIARWNRHLGRNLTIHPAAKVFAQFDQEIRGWEGTPQAYYFDGFHDDGYILEGIFVPPDIASMTVPFVGQKLLDFMKNYKYMATFGFMINDSTKGRVVHLPLLGRSILYSLNALDVRKFQKGIAFLARLFLEGGARKVITLVHGFSEMYTQEDVNLFESAHITASHIECMAFHPLGTCRMSASPDDGVVDQNFRVHGWEGLYIADGSVVPSSLGVNPQVTIMALATLCAQRLLKPI